MAERDDRLVYRLETTEYEHQTTHLPSDSNSHLPQPNPAEETSLLLNPTVDSYHQPQPTILTTNNLTSTTPTHFLRYPPSSYSDYVNPEHPLVCSNPTPQSIHRIHSDYQLDSHQQSPNQQHHHPHQITPSILEPQLNPYQDGIPDRQEHQDMVNQTILNPCHSHTLSNPSFPPPSPPHHPLSFVSTTPSSQPSYHSRTNNSFDNLLPPSSAPAHYSYNNNNHSGGSPHTIPRRLLPLLPTNSSPTQSPLSSPTTFENPNMPSHPNTQIAPQQPDNLSSFNILSQYTPPLPPPQHHVPYLFTQPHSLLNSVDELKGSHKGDPRYSEPMPKNGGYPKEFEPPTDLAQKKPRAGRSSDPRRARFRKFLMIGYRRLAIITLTGIFLILAAVVLIVCTHLKRTDHASDLTGDSDGDVVGQSGLGSARNASSSTGIDPFNATNSAFGPDNGLRGGINGYDSLVVFGASYCDNAHARPSNLRHSLKPSPYYKGRWTNGFVWNEYLSAIIGPGGRSTTLVNYAFGGATVDNGLNEAPVPDLEQQVNAFLSDLSAQSAGAGPSNGKSLIAIWVGINSITKIWNSVLKEEVNAHSQVDVQDITARAQLTINSTVDHIFEVVTNLIHTTAFKTAVPDLLLLPIPPAQLLLVNLRAAKGNLGALRTLATLNDLFNARFADKLLSFQGSMSAEQRVFTLDIPTIWHKFIEDPGSAKLTVVDQPCLTKSGACKSPDSYLFWDTLHPTTYVHKQLALMMASEIKH